MAISLHKGTLFTAAACISLLVAAAALMWWWTTNPNAVGPYRYVSTIAGTNGEFGEPFGIAEGAGSIYVSDGQQGKIWKIVNEGAVVFAEGFHTPSGIAFDESGNLIVADTGSHTIKSVDARGGITTLAGIDAQQGSADGSSGDALFNGPIGVAIGPAGEIYIADTYNDRIRVINDGVVSTLVGGSRGYADGVGDAAQFDTPCGIAIWGDRLIVADTGNRRIRVVEPDGGVWTLAGSGDGGLKDGGLPASAFVQPTAVTVSKEGVIFVADGNAIRRIGGHALLFVTTISDETRGIRDGAAARSRFNRPSGLTVGESHELVVADSENRLIRRFTTAKSGHELTPEQIATLRDQPDEFRARQPGRWPYDPPEDKRDIAGTLGEIRGEIDRERPVRFHNGLDIAGAYGETARSIRNEKVLRPIAAEHFGTLRELIRFPELGYIHIRLGRDAGGKPFEDHRFQFTSDASGKMINVRVRRGAIFAAGEPIGTLNAMNHVHLIAGRSGAEMNALDALSLPNHTDTLPPVIESVTLLDEAWQEMKPESNKIVIESSSRTRIVVRAYDQMDGNPDRRRLGVYRLGYQILTPDGGAMNDIRWEITFDRLPPPEAVRLTYARGTRSGATGETIFNYIVTNFVNGDEYREDFLDLTRLPAGPYIIRVSAADYAGNTSTVDVAIEVGA